MRRSMVLMKVNRNRLDVAIEVSFHHVSAGASENDTSSTGRVHVCFNVSSSRTCCLCRLCRCSSECRSVAANLAHPSLLPGRPAQVLLARSTCSASPRAHTHSLSIAHPSLTPLTPPPQPLVPSICKKKTTDANRRSLL
jgi:hypothetical protein